MVVKYNKVNSRGKALSFNKEYEVISIDFIHKEESIGLFQIFYRLLNENGVAGLYEQNLFEITNSEVRDDYVMIKKSSQNFELIPKSMSYPHFWEFFFNDDEKALSIFLDRFPKFKNKIF